MNVKARKKSNENLEKNPKCPKCGSENTAYIVYGIGARFGFDDKMQYNRKVSYAGCIITDESPKWECKNCKNRWGYHFERDEKYYQMQKKLFNDFCKQFNIPNDFLSNELDVKQLTNIAKIAQEKKRTRIWQQVLERILELDPKNIDVMVDNACALFLLDRYQDAKDMLDKATDMEPKNAGLWIKKGTILLEHRSFDVSLECLQKALLLEPNSVEIWFGIASAFQGLRYYKDALEWYNKVLQKESNNIKALNEKGHTLGCMGHIKEAIDCFDLVLRLYPENDDAIVGKLMYH